jgi:LPS O-antigen subunit length determinant protein (WzzB/FepE family)
MADLTAQAIALEVEMEILSKYASRSSDEYLKKKRRYDELQSQLKKFKVSSARDEDDFVRSFFPSLDKVPQVTLDFLRLARRVKIEETVNELLIKEYEKARIDEARDTPTVQVLDEATVPELRSRPKRKIMVVIGGLVGFGWSALIALLATIWREQGEQRRTFQTIFDPVIKDFSRIFRRSH